jgi:hypothetical protein
MCTSFSLRLLGLLLGAALTGCGSDLTIPVDGSPARLEAVSGSGQEGTVGSQLSNPLVVRVSDASNRPVGNVAVEFRFQGPPTDAVVDPTTRTTDTAGVASAEVRLGTTTGPLTVEAQVAPSSALRATFDLNALARDKGKGKGKDKHDDDDGD